MKHVSGDCIIIDYMIRAIIIAEMIFYCSTCMCICNVIIHRVTGFLKCPVQQFKVHHIIDNNRTLPLVTAVIPGTDTTNCWLIAGNQCSSRFQQDIFVVCIIGQAITVTKATVHFESHVMRSAIRFLVFYVSGKCLCLLLPKIILCILIHIPQFTGKETTGPVS